MKPFALFCAFFNVVFALFLFLFSAHECEAQNVRPYEDPGYSALGCYAGDFPEVFDYTLRKVFLADVFPQKKEWWQALEKRTPEAARRDIYLLYCGKRTEPVETLRRRVDAWLKSDSETETHPEKIPAVCFWEENPGELRPVLEELANHVRNTYHIPVFQWFSEPLEPSVELTADGWIWDSYSWNASDYRRHVMKFSALKKPAHCIIWASDPRWPGWEKYASAEEMMNRQWLQFGICREFNTAVSVFAVSCPVGSVSAWLQDGSPEMTLLRSAVAMKRREIQSIPKGSLPQPEANFSCRERSISVGGSADAPTEYREDFAGFHWIHDASIEGFQSLRLTSKPEKPGFLELVRNSASAQASLTYRCESFFPLESVRVSLDGEAAGGQIQLEISRKEPSADAPSETSLKKTLMNSNGMETLEISDDELIRGEREFYVQIQMKDVREKESPDVSCRLDALRIRAVHAIPEKPEPIRLKRDVYGTCTYQDDFATDRFAAFGELRVSQPSCGGWSPDRLWVGSCAGYAVTTTLRQRLAVEQPFESLTASVEGTSAESLGGSIEFTLRNAEGEILSQTASSGTFRGALTLELPPDALKVPTELLLEITLKSTSGVDLKHQRPASVEKLAIQARPAR